MGQEQRGVWGGCVRKGCGGRDGVMSGFLPLGQSRTLKERDEVSPVAGQRREAGQWMGQTPLLQAS